MTTTEEVPMPEPDVGLGYALGAGKDAHATEADRLAFEAWMRGHCWALSATWSDGEYRGDRESKGRYCADAARTRMLWAAWRDRGGVAVDQLRAYADARCAKLQAELAAAMAIVTAFREYERTHPRTHIIMNIRARAAAIAEGGSHA